MTHPDHVRLHILCACLHIVRLVRRLSLLMLHHCLQGLEVVTISIVCHHADICELQSRWGAMQYVGPVADHVEDVPSY